METELQRKERERQEDLQRLRGLRPIDDDFMRCLFRDNIPLTQHVLRILTGKGNLTITSVETQADMKRLVGARSICLDAYGTDDEIGKLMHDFSCSDPDDMINKELADRTRYFKETEEGVEAVCKVMEDMRTEKARETRIDDIQKMMIKLKMTVEQAMDVLDIPASERSIYIDKICAK